MMELSDIADVTPLLIAGYRQALTNTDTSHKKLRFPATANRYLAALNHLFTIAVKEWEWVDENPLLKVRKLKEPRGRICFLADDERKQ